MSKVYIVVEISNWKDSIDNVYQSVEEAEKYVARMENCGGVFSYEIYEREVN